jgi:hypothetical protein
MLTLFRCLVSCAHAYSPQIKRARATLLRENLPSPPATSERFFYFYYVWDVGVVVVVVVVRQEHCVRYNEEDEQDRPVLFCTLPHYWEVTIPR